MRASIFKSVTALALLVGTLVSGIAVSAMASTTDHVVTPTTCTVLNGYTYCNSEDSRYHYVATPSGNENVTGYGTQCFSLTNTATGVVSYSFCTQFKGHTLVKGGTTHEESYFSRSSVTNNGTTACYIDHYHFANGHLQFDRFEVTPGAC